MTSAGGCPDGRVPPMANVGNSEKLRKFEPNPENLATGSLEETERAFCGRYGKTMTSGTSSTLGPMGETQPRKSFLAWEREGEGGTCA